MIQRELTQMGPDPIAKDRTLGWTSGQFTCHDGANAGDYAVESAWLAPQHGSMGGYCEFLLIQTAVCQLFRSMLGHLLRPELDTRYGASFAGWSADQCSLDTSGTERQ
jgi:hypothetical protein